MTERKMYVVARAPDEPMERAERLAGIEPEPDDIVVGLTQFGGPLEDEGRLLRVLPCVR